MTDQRADESSAEQDPGGRTLSHSWMMIACCIPMLAIALLLVVTGVASPSFIVVALGCTLMMAFMMRAMDHGAGGEE